MSGKQDRHDNSSAVAGAHFYSGLVGGTVGAVLTCPLEVIKTRMQAASAGGVLNKFKLTRIVSHISRTEGFLALWKGVGPVVAGVAPSRGLYFGTYAATRDYIQDHTVWHGSPVHLVSAAVAGFVTSTANNPIWVVKTRMQLQDDVVKTPVIFSKKSVGAASAAVGAEDAVVSASHQHYKSVSDCFRRIYMEEGVAGFYKGITASYMGISEGVLQFVLYERFKEMILDSADVSELNSFHHMVCAGISKSIACVATYPHEVLRTRFRQQRAAEPGRPHKYQGIVNSLRVIYIEEGLRGLYGGMATHLLRTVPNAIALFATYEFMVKILSTNNDAE